MVNIFIRVFHTKHRHLFSAALIICIIYLLRSLSRLARKLRKLPSGSSASTEAIPSSYAIPDDVCQLAVVHPRGNNRAIFTFYQRDKNNGNSPWIPSFSCSAWLGSRGLGKKKEGDKKTPTGLYYLEQPFGIKENPGMDKGWHYIKINKSHYWCTALKGKYKKYYNHLVLSRSKIQGEHLIDYKGFYDYGMFITYNKTGKSGKGSAIFLHCSQGRPTAGCVAIKKACMKKLMKELQVSSRPAILIMDTGQAVR